MELLKRIASRDREAFARFYDRLSPVLYSTAMRILNDATQAEEVLQEIFLQIWEGAATYDLRLGRPFNWALTLTRRASIDRLRAVHRHFEFVPESSETAIFTSAAGLEAGGEVYDREKALQVRRAVQSLALEQRQAIEMAFLGGMTYSEIARRLEQPEATVKSRVRRGMLRLRDALSQWL